MRDVKSGADRRGGPAILLEEDRRTVPTGGSAAVWVPYAAPLAILAALAASPAVSPEARAAGSSSGLDGVWAPENKPAMAFLGAIRVEGGRIVMEAGVIVDGRVAYEFKDARVIGGLHWIGRETALNPICGEVEPRSILMATDPGWDPGEMIALFHVEEVAPGDDLETLGAPCDSFRMRRHYGSWEDLVDPSPEAEARRRCGAHLGTAEEGAMASCVEEGARSIREVAAFRADPTGSEAWQDCVDLLRGRGSMDFNSPELYLACARAANRNEVADACFALHKATRPGEPTDFDGMKARDQAQNCVRERLGLPLE